MTSIVQQERYLTNLVRAYEKHQVVLEDEPKKLAIQKLSTFRIKSEFARASILGYLQVLESEGEGLIAPGEEKLDLGLDADNRDEISYTPPDPPPLELQPSSSEVSSTGAMLATSNYSQMLASNAPVTTQQQQYESQDWNEWPINPFLTPPNMPTMLELTSHPWNEITSAFDGTGWSPELWQHFSAPSFNNF